jgi:hypothetical protein
MSLIGLGITGKSTPASPVLYVEYHKCDKCGCEYRVYYRSHKSLSEAILEIGRKLGRNGHGDLCFNCEHQIASNQLVMPF